MVEVVATDCLIDCAERIDSYCGRDLDDVRLQVKNDVEKIIRRIIVIQEERELGHTEIDDLIRYVDWLGDAGNEEFSAHAYRIAFKVGCNNPYFASDKIKEAVSEPESAVLDSLNLLKRALEIPSDNLSIRRITVSVFSTIAAVGLSSFGSEYPELRSDTMFVEAVLLTTMIVMWVDGFVVNQYRVKFNNLFGCLIDCRKKAIEHLEASETKDDFGLGADYVDLISQYIELFATSVPEIEHVRVITRHYYLKMTGFVSSVAVFLAYMAVLTEVSPPVLEWLFTVGVGTFAIGNTFVNLSRSDLNVMLNKLNALKKLSLAIQIADLGEEYVMEDFDERLGIIEEEPDKSEAVYIDEREDCEID